MAWQSAAKILRNLLDNNQPFLFYFAIKEEMENGNLEKSGKF
ncbi:hypothetical protein EUBDOL_01549 [Amedibacillus dolichus DSM 3991]|uniref:Uncharacterized protein n=1 Tax=Amedibacillus dolichus DSM 3991 TaxID=428127 RepID=A8RD00_9FIRM|nr:hypothetical protein EUBDOL_01549 [Amedibacillus dolichus DSM 3991]DAZ24769.1 MAG TPA: hypothetical protein [Caudoviricetes sp.]